MQEHLDKIIEELSEKISVAVLTKVNIKLDKYLNARTKITFTEGEAAAFLGVGKATLQLYRKDGLINYCHYPLGKASKTNETGLSSMFSYDLNDLLDFRERYKRTVPIKSK